MIHTVKSIKTKLRTDPRWALRGLLAIYAAQTGDEQVSHSTIHHNGVGFNGVDAGIMSSFAKQVLRNRSLSEKQMAIIYRIMPKYAGQLHRLASINEVAQKVGEANE